MAKTMKDREDAARHVIEARARFQSSMEVARRELAPATLMRRTSSRVSRRTTEVARAQPLTTALVGVALLSFLFRKPIAGLIRRLFREK